MPHGPVEKGSTPSRGLDNNPGKDAKLFNEKHPYFPRNCSSCPFKTARLRALFHSLADKKNCYACKDISEAIKIAKPTTVKEAFENIQNGEGSYIDNLRTIIEKGQYHKVKDRIYSAIDENSKDYNNLVSVAKKIVINNKNAEVYILPNPKGVKSMDIIVKNKNFLAGYDVKTITGKNSVGNRLEESTTQSYRVILNLSVDYNIRKLYKEIKKHFHTYDEALEVIIYKGKKEIILDKNMISEMQFRKLFN